MADREKKRREDFLKDQDSYRKNALILINEMDAIRKQAPGVRALVDEILHSIFFLGRINKPSFSPEEILRDVQKLKDLKNDFPGPFVFYSSQIPRRSPFSCVLDMIVHLTGRENETQIIDGLRKLISDLELDKKMYLVSSTICVSHREKDPVKYYGVSISASGRLPRRVMIAASCLGSWDEYVAGTVMTYFPTERKRDFDGTIKLPEQVRCQAFNIRENEVKPPCILCVELFGLTPGESENQSAFWPYGNCAEAESLSNLFKNVADVKERARPTSTMYSDERRLEVKMRLRKDLTCWLKQEKFTWNDTFYTPQ